MTIKKRLGPVKHWLLARGLTTARLKKHYNARGDLVPLAISLLPIAQEDGLKTHRGHDITEKILMEALSDIRGRANYNLKGKRRHAAAPVVTNTEEEPIPEVTDDLKTGPVSFKVIGDRAALMYAQVEQMLNQYGAMQEDLTTLLRAIGDLESDLANASSVLYNILKD